MDDFIEIAIDDDGHGIALRVSTITGIADTLDASVCTVYTYGGHFAVPHSRHELVRMLVEWQTAQLRKVN